MHVKSAGLSAASMALAANAILLPPGISVDAVDSTDVANTFGLDPNHQVVKVECPGCPYAESKGEGQVVWTDEVENSLVFEFDTGASRDSLSVNGAQLFPPTFGVIPPPIYIYQAPNDVELSALAEKNTGRPGLQVTGYEFRFDTAQTLSADGEELLPMTLTVHAVAHLPVPPVNLLVFVIKDAEGNLGIAHINASIEQIPAESSHEMHEMKECHDWPMVCKWKAILESKLHGLKNSFKKPGCPKMMNRPHGDHGRLPDGMHPPHHMHDGHGHHRHNKFHRFMHMLSRAMFTILVPILIGVMAGIATYLVGMVIGMTIALIWIKIRGRRSEYQAIALDEEDGVIDEEDLDAKNGKEVYLSEEIPEVVSEAPPAYRDVEEKEVVVNAPQDRS